MNLKNTFCVTAMLSLAFFAACNSNSNQSPASGNGDTATSQNTSAASENTDATKGVGQYSNVDVSKPLDAKMVEMGHSIYDLKCASCHKLTGEKLVGPGWKGVTDRRKPEWIMNFVTNTEEMLQKDTAAQNMLEVCLVKMPNQNLTESDARSVLEFMRNNDGKK